MEIRPLESRDRSRIDEIVRGVGNFSEAEIKTALELVDAWLKHGEASEYVCHVVESDSKVHGYTCFGPTPLTNGTFDLYWIAVDPASYGNGYGKALLCHAEREVKAREGRILLIETASEDAYTGTVKFYERSGYELISRIPDFYRKGDDKLTFWKQLA